MKILVVEDEHLIANSIKKGLEQEAYITDTAYDGESGLDLALSGDYDLLILDRMLPKIDGLKICQEVRSAEQHTPILMLTAKGEVRDKVQGLNSGADDYLTKPFSFEELLARVRALSRRPQELSGNVLACGDLQLDPQSLAVKRSGRPIQLSSKEFALLEYLMRNAGKILTKDQIINHVWNYDADILPNTVEVYIRYLRNKVDEPFGSPLIQTIRGFGYRLGDA